MATISKIVKNIYGEDELIQLIVPDGWGVRVVGLTVNVQAGACQGTVGRPAGNLVQPLLALSWLWLWDTLSLCRWG